MGSPGVGGSLSAASDVYFNNPIDNQVLSYDSATVKWTNKTVTGSGGTLALDEMASGVSFDVVYDGANWTYGGATVTARPTSRTDLIMQCVNPIDSSVPGFAITGDRLLRIG